MENLKLLNTTGKRVRALREQRNWTQIELAEQVTQAGKPLRNPQICKIEGDTALPSIATLRALAVVLETSADFLTLLSDNPALECAAVNGGDRQ